MGGLFQSLGKGEALEFHEEREGISSHPAAEAVEYSSLRREGEGGDRLGVEGAASYEVFPLASERGDVRADQVGGVALYFLAKVVV